MNTSIPTGTRIVDTHEGTGRTQVSYLSNGGGRVLSYLYP